MTVGWSAFTDSNIGRLDGQSGAGPTSFAEQWNTHRISPGHHSWEFLGHELSYAFQRSGLQIGGWTRSA